VEVDDKEKFSYQLLTIGSFGRLVPEYSLPLLTMLVNFAVIMCHLFKIHRPRSVCNNYEYFQWFCGCCIVVL